MQNKSIIISIIILAVVIALAAVWYFYFRTPPETFAPATTPPPEQQAAMPSGESALSAGDKTADIAKDLDQTLDESAMNDELNSLDQNLKNF